MKLSTVRGHLALILGGLLLSTQVSAQERFQLKKVNAGGGLSPELAALLDEHHDANLRSVTTQRAAIVSSSTAKGIASLSANAKALPDEKNKSHVDIKHIVISYSGKRPSKALLQKAGLELMSDNDGAKGHPTKLLLARPTGEINREMAETLQSAIESGEIKTAEPDFEVYAIPNEEVATHKRVGKKSNTEAAGKTNIPNDPEFPQLGGLRNINAPTAWGNTTGGNVVVAVIDTGVDFRHPDLQENMWVNIKERDGRPGEDDDGNGYVDDIHGYNFVDDNGTPYDVHGHGTHCAGTIAAVGNNGLGVVGVCWDAKIMALKYLNDEGFGGSSYQAARAIDYAVANKAKIISASWGGSMPSIELQNAIERARRAGVVFVAAAGNDDRNVDGADNYPSGYEVDNIIAVGAIDSANRKASFSNFGINKVDIGAPGVDILSLAPDGRYASMSGTSMATPHVAGALALLASAKPKSSGDELRDFILQNSRVEPGLRSFWGARINRLGGTLDIKAIGGREGGGNNRPGSPEKPSTHYYETASFNRDKKAETKDHRDLATVKLTLTKRTTLLVTANTSVMAKSGSRRITSLVGSQPICSSLKKKPDDFPGHPQSRRAVTVRKEEWSNVGTVFEITLDPGSHQLVWSIYVHSDGDDDSAGLMFDNGTIAVTTAAAD